MEVVKHVCYISSTETHKQYHIFVMALELRKLSGVYIPAVI